MVSSFVFVLMVLLQNGTMTEMGQYETMEECVAKRDSLKVKPSNARAILCIEGTMQDQSTN